MEEQHEKNGHASDSVQGQNARFSIRLPGWPGNPATVLSVSDLFSEVIRLLLRSLENSSHTNFLLGRVLGPRLPMALISLFRGVGFILGEAHICVIKGADPVSLAKATDRNSSGLSFSPVGIGTTDPGLPYHFGSRLLP
jgi:hypothetical protein